ncbi:hypothetical protein BCR26_03100 [Enterococcus rivorum]|uniref:MapZ extracellular domain-containing protein n=3 Tax=Enterococcus rivorum TaxID=762845 RepID=A0A1E5KX58_9ENTE|nr:hypothetical protein BCR26_03100 [Enterococcus rivorum]
MLNRNFFKIGIASMIIVISIGICILGYKVSADKQKRQKIEYAEITLKSEKQKKDKLTTAVDGLFKDKQQVFLADDLKEETVSQVASTLLTLKTTAEDFGLEEADIDVDETLIKKKEELTQKVTDAQRKYRLQVRINGLFTESINSWNSENLTHSIEETTTIGEINKVREEVGLYNDEWRKTMMLYLNSAQEQIEQYEQMKKAINEMLDGETLTEKANYDTYLVESNKLTLLKNEKMRQELSEKLSKIALLLGVSAQKPQLEENPVIPVQQQGLEQNFVDEFGNPIVQ